MEVDAAVPQKKIEKDLFEELIDVEELVSVDASKIFKKAFLNKLKDMDVESFGFMFSPKDGLVMIIHSVPNNKWIYMSMPALDDKLKNKIFRYLKAEVINNENEE